MLGLLLQHNALPYIAIVIMGGLLYWGAGELSETRYELKEEKATSALTASNMNTIQTYNESRFKALEGVRRTKWKKGKHESSF